MNNNYEKNIEFEGSQMDDVETVDKSTSPLSLSALDNIAESRTVPVVPGNNRLPLDVMLDVPISLIFEVARTNITIRQLMELREGSYVELRNVLVDSIDVRVNDNIIAQAEAIGFQKRYGIRFGELEIPSNIGEENENV